MNKKTLFFILLLCVLALPLTVMAETSPLLQRAMDKIREAAIYIGGAMTVIGTTIAGILYLSSAGSPEKMTTAKRAMIAAVIGVALVILAYTQVFYNLIKELLAI